MVSNLRNWVNGGAIYGIEKTMGKAYLGYMNTKSCFGPSKVAMSSQHLNGDVRQSTGYAHLVIKIEVRLEPAVWCMLIQYTLQFCCLDPHKPNSGRRENEYFLVVEIEFCDLSWLP